MIVKVIVKPGSKKGPLVVNNDSSDTSGSEMVVYLREKPHDGEANVALVRLLADYFGVAKTCVVIRGGQKSHHKMVEIVK